MQIIEQPWEKKNLDVHSVEFRFDNSDSRDIDKNVLDNKDFDYQLCRVPVGRMDLAYALQENGFKFAETSFELSADLNNLELPNLYKKYEDRLRYSIADKIQIDDIYKCIRSGVFDTDKIALDPFFEHDKSGNRFANWCQQEIDSNNAKAYIVCDMENPIGFFVLKNLTEKSDYSLLASLFKREQTLGFGFSVLYYPMLQAKLDGKRKIVTGVSSNNIASLRMHLGLGYNIKSMNYVLIKHVID